ncbi:MAG: sigma-70 family RNA polymerase sigma factor [Anaerolineae bacterium]
MHWLSDDIDIMRRIAARDQQAFQQLYQRYGKPVYSLAYRVLQNSTLAEEVTQDTFLKIWQQRAHWDSEKGKLLNWLLTITQFTAIDRLRQEKRQPQLHPEAIEDADEGLVAAQGELQWQDGTVLRGLIAQLPQEQAALIDLAFFQGMTHGEIADATHLPLGTVKTRLRGGLQRLRELWLETANQTSRRL